MGGGRVLESLLQDEIQQNQDMLLAVCNLAKRFGEKTVHAVTSTSKKNYGVYLPTCSESTKREEEVAKNLLSLMKRRQSVKGAFETVVALGIFSKHENLHLLRSNFPTYFSPEEERAAVAASENEHDPDQILDIRKDFRRFRVYTIDSAATKEVDDGISLEVITNPDGTIRRRIWVHISDVDRWAPRDSKLIGVAKTRGTSLYMPTRAYNMFPPYINAENMSLARFRDSCALSVGVELNEDGSVIKNSIIVTPSLIRVKYRLTYNECDEMLEEGVAYKEEWQLGAMYNIALNRRKYREDNGAIENIIPVTIPKCNLSVKKDRLSEDSCSISLKLEVTHNSGQNRSMAVDFSSSSSSSMSFETPTPSQSNLLVTEIMILSAEAIGIWGTKEKVPLPYRTQQMPCYDERPVEHAMLKNLQENNVAGGLAAAWYCRRFFQPVKIELTAKRHAGLGLDSYVQWTSPIRRFQDLNVHAAIKRRLRQKRVSELCNLGIAIPKEIKSSDLGIHLSGKDDCIFGDPFPIDYSDGGGLVKEGRSIMKLSQTYWVLEYIRRLTIGINGDKNKVFESTVLGTIDNERAVHVVYIHELGFETSYRSPFKIVIGQNLKLKVSEVDPFSNKLVLFPK